MERWPINAWMRVMVVIAISLDRILIGIVVELIATSSDHASMNRSLNRLRSARIVYRWMSTVVLTVGSMVGLTVGLTVNSTWLCWAINLSKVFDSLAERLLRLSTERV
jgi:hypothetical protein